MEVQYQAHRHNNSQMKHAINYVRRCYLELQKMPKEEIIKIWTVPKETDEVHRFIDELQTMPLSKDVINFMDWNIWYKVEGENY